MKQIDLKGLGERELVAKEMEISEALANSRFQHSLGQLEQTSEIKALRRMRARVKTEIRRREISDGLPKDELYRRHQSAGSSGESGEPQSDASAEGGGLLSSLKRRLAGTSSQTGN